MKWLCVISLAVVCAMAADISVQYAGTTSNAPYWTPPNLSDESNVACAPSTNNYTYVTFNATFPTAGVREVSAMAEQNFKYSVRIYIYRGSYPTNVCSNLAHTFDLGKDLGNDGGPVIDTFVYFAAATYTFVVTGDTGGIFAVHVDPTDAFGQTTAASPLWNYPEDTPCSAETGTGTGFGVYNWNQQTTGQFDVFVFFSNDSASDQDLYSALYQGSPSVQAISENACNASVLLGINNADAFGLYYPAFNLTAGQNYTLAFGLDSGNYGYWGVHVIPTRIRYYAGDSGWEQPRSSVFPQCTPNSDYSSTAYGVTFFQAQQSVYIIDTAAPPDPYAYVDTYSFLYYGANTAVPPSTCPVFAPLVLAGDTGDITPIYSFTTIGQNYTVVVSTYGSSAIPAGSVYVLYFYTGAPIGSIPATGTTGATTGVTTGVTTGTATNTGASTVTGSTASTATATGSTATATGAITTATASHSTSTTGSKSTSGASQLTGVALVSSIIALSALL